MSEKRVVITGMGAITPIGNNVEDFWKGIKNKECGIGPITQFNASNQKVKIAAEIKDFRPIDEAIITSGGINVKEINPKTMESKKVKGLYFAGEIIDVDGYTGGFNLQIAYSTGYMAGKN